MQNLGLLCISLFSFFQLSTSRNLEPTNLTQLETTSSKTQNDLTSLQDMMTALNALSATQKQLLEQQREYELDVNGRHQKEEEREYNRSLTLSSGQSLLEEIRGTVHRKIKSLGKNNAQGTNIATQMNRPKDCGDLYLEGDDKSGVYTVWPLWNRIPKSCTVYCDMETDGGGWTVIHRRKGPEAPRSYFHRTWNDYKKGFGDLESGFWLGNECIHEMTSQGVYELRFDVNMQYSTFDSFYIDGEDHYFQLHLGGYVVTSKGDDVLSISSEANFTTYDKNNIEWTRKETSAYYSSGYTKNQEMYQSKCAEDNFGWWHTSSCEINSEIHPSMSIEMKIRPTSFTRKKEVPS